MENPGWPDASTMSGDDRKVSIRTTLATSLTRAQDTAGSGVCRDGISETSKTKERKDEQVSREIDSLDP